MPDRGVFTRQNTNMISGDPPRSPQIMNSPAQQSRVLRERMIDHSAAIDNAQSYSRPAGTPKLVVQVIDGGSMPTSVPNYFLVNPVQVSGTETEGGTAVLMADTTTSMCVVVLNGVPAVSQFLDAYLVGNRWVAIAGGGGEGGGTSNPCSTAPCSLPATNLTLSYSGSSFGGAWNPGSGTLVTTGVPTCSWSSGCISSFEHIRGSSFEFLVSVAGSGPTAVTTYELLWWNNAASSCTNNNPNPDKVFKYASDGSITTLTLVSFNCATHTLVFNATATFPPVTINANFSVTW